jgi:hypothetical protein
MEYIVGSEIWMMVDKLLNIKIYGNKTIVGENVGL